MDNLFMHFLNPIFMRCLADTTNYPILQLIDN